MRLSVLSSTHRSSKRLVKSSAKSGTPPPFFSKILIRHSWSGAMSDLYVFLDSPRIFF